MWAENPERGATSMPTEIGRGQVQELVEGGAQLVEVLPRDEYEAEHLPGAINIPLRELDSGSSAKVDAARPVVVYCWDSA
jgi:rhodanese-related sulfurtransferase